MIKAIIDTIRSLNEGNVVPLQEGMNAKIDLYHDKIYLYIEPFGKEKKYYYFADFEIDAEENDNLEQIESDLLNNEMFSNTEKPSPSDSYLILLWKVEGINESMNFHIMNIEENEFFYKKYIFYYTENELESFLKWYKVLEDKGNGSLTKTLQELQNLSDESEEVSFLTRLLIKVPFLKPVFPKAVMDDFNIMVEQRIDGIRQKGQKATVKKINDILMESMNKGSIDIDALSLDIYQKLMED